MIRRGGDRHIPTNFINTTSSKKIWTPAEDDALRNLVNQYGTKDWLLIAASLPDRSGKQCRERWHNHLDCGIKKGDWTEEEDEIIITMQKALGNQWAKITKMLPGRTDNAVKNRFHFTERLKNREKYEHGSIGKSSSEDSFSKSNGGISHHEGAEMVSSSEAKGKKRPGHADRYTVHSSRRSKSSSQEVSAISHQNSSNNLESTSVQFSSMQGSSNGHAAGSTPPRWSQGTAPTVESSLIDDNDACMGNDLEGSLPFRKEDFLADGPNFLDFSFADSSDYSHTNNKDVAEIMQRFHPFQCENNITVAQSKCNWQQGSSVVVRNSGLRQTCGGPVGDDEVGDASDADEDSAANDLMDMDILSFDDEQIYMDNRRFSHDRDARYDTDDEEAMETCGVGGVAACSAGGTFQTTTAAMGAALNWGRSRRLDTDGLPIQEAEEEEPMFDFDQCCFFNPFDWNSYRHGDGQSTEIDGRNGMFGRNSPSTAARSSSGSRSRATTATVTSALCGGVSSGSRYDLLCGCGGVCSECSGAARHPASTRSPFQQQPPSSGSSTVPSYVLYSNPTMYSLNDSMEAVTGAQNSTTNNVGFAFAFGTAAEENRISINSNKSSTSSTSSGSQNHRRTNQEGTAVSSTNMNGNSAFTVSHLRAPSINDSNNNSLESDQRQPQSQSPSQSQPHNQSQWKTNFSSSSMASYFWSNSLR